MNNQDSVYGYGLYYPYIHFQDENWIKTAVLYYDGLKRIVPEGYETHDSRSLEILNDKLEFVENLDPGYSAELAAEGFMKFVEQELADTERRTAIKNRISQSLPPKYGFQIHSEKVVARVKDTLSTMGLIEEPSKSSSWYPHPVCWANG